MLTKVYNMAGDVVGEIELSEAVFGIEPNKSVVHDMVKNHLANLRQGTQSALTRAEVSGGGRKPWRQKGTGRARQGSTRAPQWTHGGIVFAPKPRNYSYTLNKKAKRLALKSALSAKAQETAIVVIDEIKMDAPKTSVFAKFLKAVGCETKTLVVTANADQNVVKSGRNIPGCEITFANLINVYDIVNASKLVDIYTLSYIQDFTQEEIAKVLNLEQYQVSRILKELDEIIYTAKLNDGTRDEITLKVDYIYDYYRRTGKLGHLENAAMEDFLSNLLPEEDAASSTSRVLRQM